jgi:excisionase family DNA binding protein
LGYDYPTSAKLVVWFNYLTYSIKEAAEKLGIERKLAYRQARAGIIPTIRIGKRYLVPKARLEKMLAGEPVEVEA